MQPGWSRRAFLGCLSFCLRGEDVASELRRFRDAATEFEILRLTDPQAGNSRLVPAHLRGLSSRQNHLLYASDRSGRMQAYRMNLKTGESRLLSAAENLDPLLLSWLPDERSICYFDGPRLVVSAGSRRRELLSVPPSSRPVALGLSVDGNIACVAENSSGTTGRLRIVNLRGNPQSRAIVEREGGISAVLPRPRRDSVLFRDEQGWCLANYNDGKDRRLRFASNGTAGPALWSADGRTIQYLFFPDDRKVLHQLREHTPDTNEDKLLASTTQFVNFARNGDASVFAGVSGSKASPHILLLLRVNRRELTICEHRAPDAPGVVVLFSPGSQRIFFESPMHGKRAIYSVQVERFVEKTEDSDSEC